MKILLYILVFTNFLFSQTFSPNVIIEPPVPNQAERYPPSIGLNSFGDLGILWSVSTWDDITVKFVKSYDEGLTFDSIRVVDHDPNPPYFWFSQNTPIISFDHQNNPLVLYHTIDWSGILASARISKSDDGGHSFPPNPLNFIGYETRFTYINISDTLGLLAYQSAIHEVKFMKTTDSGHTFSDLLTYDCGTGLAYKINLIKCDNGDILFYWTGGPEPRLRFARSTDNGQSFSNVQIVDNSYPNGTGIYASSYNEKIFITYLAFDSLYPLIIFQKSNDYGHTFSQPQILKQYPINTFGNHPGPAISLNPNVGLGIIWSRGAYIKFIHSPDFGESFDSTLTLPTNSPRVRGYDCMAISDSGDVYVVSRVNSSAASTYIVLNKLNLPVLTKLVSPNPNQAKNCRLSQNYPNPFNSTTQISFFVPKSSYIQLKIYDINGRIIKTILSKMIKEGSYKTSWNGLDNKGNNVASGIYIYQLITSSLTINKKLIHIK